MDSFAVSLVSGNNFFRCDAVEAHFGATEHKEIGTCIRMSILKIKESLEIDERHRVRKTQKQGAEKKTQASLLFADDKLVVAS